MIQLDGGSIAVAGLNSNKEMYRRNGEHVPSFANDSCGSIPARAKWVKKAEQGRMDHRSSEEEAEEAGQEAGLKKIIKIGNDCNGPSIGTGGNSGGNSGTRTVQACTGGGGGVPNELETVVYSTCVYDSIYEKDGDWRHRPRSTTQQDGGSIAVAELNSNKEMHLRGREHVPSFANDSCGSIPARAKWVKKVEQGRMDHRSPSPSAEQQEEAGPKK